MRTAASLADHPLYRWVEYAALRRELRHATAERIGAFLERHPGEPVAELLRDAWVAELVRRRDWSAFRAFYVAPADAAPSDTLACASLVARQATGTLDAAWWADLESAWRVGRSMPDLCDGPFATAAAAGRLTPELRWARLDLAAEAGNPGVMRAAAAGLADADRALAEDYAAFVAEPHDRAAGWPRSERSRRIAAQGLALQARKDPDAAEARLARLAAALGMSEPEQAPALYQIALWTVASYHPGAAERLARVPAAAYDERLYEWRVREALARGDDRAALAAIAAMPQAQRDDSRWRYFQARLLERLGRAAEAREAYAWAATASTFHGFLAADRIDAPYALCPWEPEAPVALVHEVENDPGLQRALALYRMDRTAWATREWRGAMARFDDARRFVAIELAQRDADWYDRAVFSLGEHPDALRLYSLRFPLHHERTLREQARRNGLDPALVAADIRAESAWMPRARSGADALGLMQLLPSTAEATARRIGLPWRGRQSLFDPDTNLTLGTAHLRYELDKQGLPYMAIAAYNAGPGPVARWNAQRPGFDPDFWIETMTYRETRDYVARVLAFSVIYDWRLEGRAVSVTERMRSTMAPTARTRPFACPAVQAR
ncbi:lytic transglycosylase domain-containing protein [Coralloluteibacterium stylophorae]|uniref:Lytic transglycosylase domain-containing protein n=1 Tax=Coralloluteibacterium stylophorae TaxID=1776034 RepID=A0A8J8AZ94_9GAMM|nr:lytic transglycosylase domain-containing protein [Coralloluteibacterium stylophorae]